MFVELKKNVKIKKKFKIEKSNNSTFVIFIFEISKFRNIGRSTFIRRKLICVSTQSYQAYISPSLNFQRTICHFRRVSGGFDSAHNLLTQPFYTPQKLVTKEQYYESKGKHKLKLCQHSFQISESKESSKMISYF